MSQPEALTISRWLVVLQVLCLAGLLLTGRWLTQGIWLWVEVLGFALGLWALLSFRLRQLRIFPEPHPEGKLVTHGPYRWIRHPMYSAVILVATSWVGDDPRWYRLLLGILLLVVLVIKLMREEELLAQKFPDYTSYQKTSWRLIPPLW